MKKGILFIIIIIFSVSPSWGQERVLNGFHSNGMPGLKYYDTIRTLNLLSPLYNPNDSTIAIDTSRLSFTVSKNATGDSIIFLFAGGDRYAVKDSIGAGGGSGMVIGDVISGATVGSILYAGTGGRLQQSNSIFYYDSANNKIGLGTTTGSSLRAIEVLKTVNNAQRISMINNSTGTTAAGFLEGGNGTVSFQAGALGTSYTTVGLNTANTVLFQSNGASKMMFKVIQSASESAPIVFAKNQAGIDTERWRIAFGNGSLSNTAADGTAGIHLKAGTASAGTAPIKFTAGVLMITPESGTAETNATNNLFYTDGSAVRGAVQVNKTTGTGATSGISTLVAGTVTVNTTSALTASNIQLTTKTVGGTQGFLSYTIVNGTSFTINSSSPTDTSDIGWVIINQ